MKQILPFSMAALVLSSCGFMKPASTETVEMAEVIVETPKIVERPLYRESEQRINDVLHTKLEVSFDWGKQYLNGKATIDVKPYFHPVNKLTLDAKGFDIHKVALVTSGGMKDLAYDYDGWFLDVTLDKRYNRNDEYTIYVEYTAKPNELKTKGGSSAISGDKGLYFINPEGKEDGFMPQIWTQGETEASSCWYPTIDAPNERMTQEIYMTVQDKYKTLSNGLLLTSKKNNDGTRTDHWKQTKAHAPYLTMMAVGEFAKVEDTWDGIDVDYYVEKDQEPYADLVFGMTPDMLEFYSKRLRVKYPWEKYAQIVVREYVSGAMENTSAVIHGDFVYNDDRTILDGSGEDVIAHELFHHWFGDLVTCESWSNLPLNESFATYGEYLWIEHSKGRDAADHHNKGGLSGYLAEAKSGKQVDMIRFDVEDKEDMFDSHSYAKGGRILHMLRSYLGDDAFFEGLRVYLEDNKYTDVEIHDLRIAMEKVCGEDLNWFFNQWFLAAGHPNLDIQTSYDDATGEVVVVLEQKQSFETTPLYKLPLEVDIYANGKIQKESLVMEKQMQEFRFASARPDLVNVDAQKMLLCEKKENKTEAEYLFQYFNAPLFLDRDEALDAWTSNSDKVGLNKIVTAALDDTFWSLRQKALGMVKGLDQADKDALKSKIEAMAKNDEKASVRARAYSVLSTLGAEVSACEAGLKDKSYAVNAAALNAIYKADSEIGMKEAKALESEAKGALLNAIVGIYAKSGDVSHMDFMQTALNDANGFAKFQVLNTYASYLSGLEISVIESSVAPILDACENGDPWWMRLGGMQAISSLIAKLEAKADNADAKSLAASLSAKRDAIKEAETNEQLKGYYNRD